MARTVNRVPSTFVQFLTVPSNEGAVSARRPVEEIQGGPSQRASGVRVRQRPHFIHGNSGGRCCSGSDVGEGMLPSTE